MKTLHKLTKLFAFILLLVITVSACAQEGAYEERETGGYNAYQEENATTNEEGVMQNEGLLQNEETLEEEGALQNEGAM